MPVRKSAAGKKIVLLGAGNVAHYLAAELVKSKNTIMQVYSKTEASAKELASTLRTVYTTNPTKLLPGADFYIIAVKDDAIAELSNHIKLEKGFIVHTSGTSSIHLLKNCAPSYGVLYPLQSFSGAKIYSKHIPLCIEANNTRTEKILASFARSLSNDIHFIDSEKRKWIHLAAVFACNFSNHMYALATDILKKEKLSFKLLIPLIEETAEKIKRITPEQAQTGPARRNDKKIIQQHLKMLNTDKESKEIYQLLTKSILRKSKSSVS